MLKRTFFLLALITSLSAFSQWKGRPINKRIIVKSNLLNWVAGQPSISVEKFFPKGFSAEFSYVQGTFDNFLFTDRYQYNGFLARAKKYIFEIEPGSGSPFVGIYFGNLSREIKTEGYIDNTGWFSFPTRNFKTNSIRTGASTGYTYIFNNKIILDAQLGLGYGAYPKNQRPENYKGYLDAQVWLSVGYCF